jgi:hypothetical protein
MGQILTAIREEFKCHSKFHAEWKQIKAVLELEEGAEQQQGDGKKEEEERNA